MPGNVGANRRLTLEGEGADVRGCWSCGGGGDEGSGGGNGARRVNLFLVPVSVPGVFGFRQSRRLNFYSRGLV